MAPTAAVKSIPAVLSSSPSVCGSVRSSIGGRIPPTIIVISMVSLPSITSDCESRCEDVWFFKTPPIFLVFFLFIFLFNFFVFFVFVLGCWGGWWGGGGGGGAVVKS